MIIKICIKGYCDIDGNVVKVKKMLLIFDQFSMLVLVSQYISFFQRIVIVSVI